MKTWFVRSQMGNTSHMRDWLNSLVGNDCQKGKILRVLSWQILPEGKYFVAFALVEVE